MERLNSQKKFKIDDSFRAKITKISLPGGGGKRRIIMYPLAKRKRAAHSIVTVNVGGNLCLPAALYLGKYRQTHDVSGWDKNTWYGLIKSSRAHLLEQKVTSELKANGLPVGTPYTLSDIDHIERVLYPDYQMVESLQDAQSRSQTE